MKTTNGFDKNQLGFINMNGEINKELDKGNYTGSIFGTRMGKSRCFSVNEMLHNETLRG